MDLSDRDTFLSNPDVGSLTAGLRFPGEKARRKSPKYRRTQTMYDMDSRGLTLWNPSGPSPFGKEVSGNIGVSGRTGGMSPSRRIIGSPLAPSNDMMETFFWEFEGEAPVFGEMPEFKAPEWNEKEIKKMTQKYAAPEARKLRQAMQLAATRPYENPNVRRMSLREALQGYGQGIENVVRGASQQARSAYLAKYNQAMRERELNYRTRVQQKFAEYENAWKNYFQTGRRVSMRERINKPDKLRFRDVYKAG